MLRLLITTLFIFSVHGCGILRQGRRLGLRGDECKAALAPTYTEQQLEKAAVAKCITEQSGLQDIIDSLRLPLRALHPLGRLLGKKCKDVTTLLEDNSYTTEATTLRACVARERDMLNADESYNMAALKDSITSKVTGLDIAANTQLGLDNCPEVEEFDVAEYMTCITSYCRTGAAP